MPSDNVPTHQPKGAIILGPTQYVVCPECKMGQPKQRLKKHLKDTHKR